MPMYGIPTLEFQHFLQRQQIKCQGNYMKIHSASFDNWRTSRTYICLLLLDMILDDFGHVYVGTYAHLFPIIF